MTAQQFDTYVAWLKTGEAEWHRMPERQDGLRSWWWLVKDGVRIRAIGPREYLQITRAVAQD